MVDSEQDYSMTEFNMGAHYMMSLRRLLDEASIAGIENNPFLKYKILSNVEEEIGWAMKEGDQKKIDAIKKEINKEIGVYNEVGSNICGREEQQECKDTILNHLHTLGKELRIIMYKVGVLVPKEQDPMRAMGGK